MGWGGGGPEWCTNPVRPHTGSKRTFRSGGPALCSETVRYSEVSVSSRDKNYITADNMKQISTLGGSFSS